MMRQVMRGNMRSHQKTNGHECWISSRNVRNFGHCVVGHAPIKPNDDPDRAKVPSFNLDEVS